MTTRELVTILRNTTYSSDFDMQLKTEAAYKLEELQQYIDNMLNNHYVDYLDFYANRCRELEEENEDLNQRLDEIRSLIERHVSE